MPSILQQQLQQVSTTWGAPTGKRQRGKPSLLYTAQEAADVDLQSLYELAQEGLEQLCSVETRFEPFQRTLFSQAGLELNRDERTKADNQTLDASLGAFLCLLTDHFLSVAAFQTLEYLIRRYRVNEFNVVVLIACGLPYHATNHFVRLVQLLHLDNTCWKFLSPMQKSGAAMSRALLVQRCVNDQAVLHAICEDAKAVSSDVTASSSMQSFYAVLLCELLLATQPVKEGLVRLLLPYLMAGLGANITADYRAATLMIVTQLASQATLTDSLLADIVPMSTATSAASLANLAALAAYSAGLVQEMLKHMPSTQTGQAVMVLCHLALTQSQLKQLSPAVFKSIMKIPDLVDHLKGLSDQGMALGPLLALLLPPLGNCIFDKKLYLKTALQLVKKLPLGMHAQLFATTLLNKLPQATADQRATLTPIIRTLDLNFPDQTDAAVNHLLQHSEGDKQAAAQGVAELLQAALAGSVHAPLTASGSTLALAVDSPSAEMRIQALKQLDATHQACRAADPGKAASASSMFLQDVLLRRLADDESAVVTTVLSLPSLADVPGTQLYAALAPVIKACTHVLRIAGRRSEHKAWRAVARKALRLLSEDFVQKHPGLKQQVVLQLLNNSVVLGNNRKLAVEAISVLQGHSQALLSGLKAVNLAGEDPAAAADADTPASDTPDAIAPTTPDRTTAKAADLSLNQALVDALASQPASDRSSDADQALSQAQELIIAADNFPHARHLLLLALLRACHVSTKPSGIALTIVRVVDGLWAVVAASAGLTGPTPAAVEDQHGVATAAHFKQWEKKASKSHAAVLQQALLVGLHHVNPHALQSLPGNLAPLPFLTALLLLAPQTAFHPHCCAFLAKTAEPAKLLSDIFGVASSDKVQQSMQEHALRLLQPYLTSASPQTPSAVLLPRLLAAAASSRREVRVQALDCLVKAGADTGTAARLVSPDLLAAAPLQAFLAAVAEQHADILGDGLGLLQVVKHLLPQVKARPHGHAAKAGAGHLDPKVSSAIVHYTLEVMPQLHNDGSIAAASLLLHILSGSAAPAQLLQSAVATLRQLPLTSDSGSQPSLPQIQLACELLQLFTSEAFQALPTPKGSSKAAKGAGSLATEGFGMLLQLMRVGVEGHLVEGQELVKLREAAFGRLDADVYAVMPVQQQMQAFLALLNGSSRDPSEGARKAARSALSHLPLTALSLVPLLTLVDKAAATEADMPAPKTRKRSQTESSVKQAADGLDILHLAGEATGLELCTSVLELLQWKEDIQDEAELVAPLCKVLQQLLSTAGQASARSAATLSSGQTAMDISDEAPSDEEDDADLTVAQSSRSTHQGYAMALALQAVQNIAGRALVAWLTAVDVSLVLTCAKEAPDGAVRNAALSLLEVLALKLPDTTLQHVLEVVSVIGSSASQQDDSHSHQVAAATLAAVVPAWLQAGKPLAQLAAAVVDPLADLLPHRRLPLLTALIVVVPQDAARSVVLSLLLQQALHLSSEEEVQHEKTSAQPLPKRLDSWPIVLANSVCHQASMLQRIQALTSLLDSALAESEQQPQQPLPGLAVTFAATQVQESAVGVSAARSSDDVQAAYSALLEQALSHLQLLGVESASAKHSKKKAQERLYALLEALAKVMNGGAYVSALLQLTQHPSEAVIRRALKLLTASLTKVGQQDARPRAEIADDASQGSAEAALELCNLAPALLQTGDGGRQLGASTRQAVLIAVSSLGDALGPVHPKPFIAVLPALVAAAKDMHRSVRSSALAAAASCLAALGSAALPLLPKLVPAVLAAAQTAVDSLPISPPPQEGESDKEEESSTEGPALEAAAALAAVAALVEGLKAFLSPHLSALLHLLFSPPVLACKQAGCSESASSIRIQLAGVIPPRLLLAPLFAHFDGALKEGEAATVSLLAMAQRTMELMDPTTAAQHADACFTFLLKALDLRQKRPAHLPALDVIEQGSVAVLLALTMKLSEVKFKPLFLRLLDWATTPPAAQPDAKPLGRQVALFTAVLGLTERLRTVFLPYFRYLVDPIAAHLGGSAVEAEGHKRKKKKKSTAGVVAVSDESSTDPGVVEDTWRLRFKLCLLVSTGLLLLKACAAAAVVEQVVQALHSCFLYDTVSFLDEARFHRLLPLLVSQLAAQPPTAASALFGAQQTPSAAPELGTDLFGDAVVSALVQMAVTANNDALWKSLNHQTLMATRSRRSVSERLRAVAAVEGLVGRMREEYLLLLPETIPFVAELLEDPEHQVRVVTQRLIKTLEELSGESLEQYLQA